LIDLFINDSSVHLFTHLTERAISNFNLDLMAAREKLRIRKAD